MKKPSQFEADIMHPISVREYRGAAGVLRRAQRTFGTSVTCTPLQPVASIEHSESQAKRQSGAASEAD
jgi:hypothetical protein